MAARHTSGPWLYGGYDWKTDRFRVTRGDGRTEFRLIFCDSEPFEVREANAKLMLAAPDLLAELKAFVPSVPAPDAMCHRGLVAQDQCSFCQRVIRAHALIAKSEGTK
jgi:hypothetical protein